MEENNKSTNSYTYEFVRNCEPQAFVPLKVLNINAVGLQKELNIVAVPCYSLVYHFKLIHEVLQMEILLYYGFAVVK